MLLLLLFVCIFISSLQIYFNTLNFPKLGSVVLIIYPLANSICIFCAYAFSFNSTGFVLLSILLNFLITIILGYFLYNKIFVNLSKFCSFNTFIKYLKYYISFSHSLLLVRVKFLIKQNAPILIINGISGPDMAGLYGIITKLIVLANSITAKVVFLSLPRLLQSRDIKKLSK